MARTIANRIVNEPSSASPSTAIDLPLKMLVWEDAAKKVWSSYNSPEY